MSPPALVVRVFFELPCDTFTEVCLCGRVWTKVVSAKQRTLRAVSSLPDCCVNLGQRLQVQYAGYPVSLAAGLLPCRATACSGPNSAVANLVNCISRREGAYGGSSPGQPRQQILLTEFRGVDPQAAA